MREPADGARDRLARGADAEQAEPDQPRDEQHRQNVACGEGGEEGVGHHAQQEVARTVDLPRAERTTDVDPGDGGGDGKTGAGPQQAGDEEAAEECEDGDREEDDQCACDRGSGLARAALRDDAVDDRAEQDRWHHHPHRLDERDAERRKADPELGP